MFHIQENIVLWVSAIAMIQTVRWLYSRATRRSVSEIDGPPKSHWLLGNLTDLHFKDAGIPNFAWQEKYGTVFKVWGMFGDEYLMISDPKAVQHVYSAVDIFVRQQQSRELIRAVTGPGLVVADGRDHRRHRRVIQPAFGVSHLKALLPVFVRHSQKLSSVLKDDIEAHGEGRAIKLDMYKYMQRATFDIIGAAAFDYQFDALDKKQDSFMGSIRKLQGDAFVYSSKRQVFAQYITEYMPLWMLHCLIRLPIKKFRTLRATHDHIMTVSNRLVKDKLATYMSGQEGEKDVMSLLVRANALEDKKWKLSDEEVNSEIGTFILAGQGTSTNILAFGLWELAKNQGIQRRVREEIIAMKRLAVKQGETEIGADKYENMPLLTAFIKEALRLHPIAFNGNRTAKQDTIIPLSQPLKLTSGRVVNELQILKGQKFWININGYNRLPELFGNNPHEFSIDRWLDPAPGDKTSPGVYGNLMTFAHGPRACVGWRFAVWEIQVILVELLSNFEFTVPEDGTVIRRMAAAAMVPFVEGDDSKASLPLNVSILKD